MNIEQILNKFYGEYVEDDRLSKDKVHALEAITTKKYIDDYLKPGSRILEVGAGTGAYSLYYASKGYRVDAVELVLDNIKTMKKHIKDKSKTITKRKEVKRELVAV